MLKKPNHNKVKSPYDWKLTLFRLGGDKLTSPRKKTVLTIYRMSKKLKKWLVYVLKDAEKAKT